jgi:hypothetical protein
MYFQVEGTKICGYSSGNKTDNSIEVKDIPKEFNADSMDSYEIIDGKLVLKEVEEPTIEELQTTMKELQEKIDSLASAK